MAKRKKISSPKRKKNTTGASPSVSDSKKKMKKLEVKEEEKEVEINMTEEEEVEELEEVEEAVMELVEKADPAVKVSNDDDGGDSGDEVEARFVGEPVPEDEARRRWPKRYQEKAAKRKQVVGMKTSNDNDETIQARCHYMKAEVDGRIIYNLYDDAHVKAGEGEADYICKIVEMFEAVDGTLHFTAQWYYRARDTVIKNHADLIDNKRVFFSEVQDDNPLDCLVERLSIARVPLNVDLDVTKKSIPKCDYYCDMLYLLPYSTFVKLPPDNKHPSSETSSTISSEIDTNRVELEEVSQVQEHHKPEVTLLDLYSGCGAMSTGLCLGANLSGLNLVTRWAVDLNKYACESLKLNHPETQVRNESAEDFLSLLEEWKKLCIYFSVVRSDDTAQEYVDLFTTNDDDGDEGSGGENDESDGEEGEVFEVQNVIAICYGDPNKSKEHGRGLYLKVRWKGYEADADSWEPIRGLGNCREAIKDFVTHGFKSSILPLPGDVDVICGGPPCQGISGFNRFRNTDNPLDDEKNKQLIVFMDLVQYLKPKFVLMENVVDIVKFANGFLGRYALGRLIGMNYQVRMGMMAAGAYGLPQFRMRVFLWGALPTEKLPQYALPTHDVIVRGVAPLEFEMNIVAYNEGHNTELEEKLLLKDAISDLPAVENNENRDEMPYDKPAQTEFQRNIRLTKDELMGSSMPKPSRLMLYDHFPLELNKDDYDRVCRVPKRKGANFRDLPGVRVGLGNKVEWDPDVERVYLASGKPLVPDYAMSFVNGTSSKPFARLWWDETVPTVVTRAEPHNQAILHPEQDRVLSIRENARLQGFPDYYQLCGPVKERYIQVGNAVAVPVARALGYALGLSFGLACQGSCVDEPLFRLPPRFPNILERYSSAASEDDA